MSVEIGSSSAFMQALRAELPANMRLWVVHSKSDEVTLPQTASSRSQFDAVVAQAHQLRVLSGVGYSDFVLDKSLLLSGNTSL